MPALRETMRRGGTPRASNSCNRLATMAARCSGDTPPSEVRIRRTGRSAIATVAWLAVTGGVAWAESAPVHPMPPTMQRMRRRKRTMTPFVVGDEAVPYSARGAQTAAERSGTRGPRTEYGFTPSGLIRPQPLRGRDRRYRSWHRPAAHRRGHPAYRAGGAPVPLPCHPAIRWSWEAW